MSKHVKKVNIQNRKFLNHNPIHKIIEYPIKCNFYNDSNFTDIIKTVKQFGKLQYCCCRYTTTEEQTMNVY